MKRFNFDEIDDIALEVARADIARANGEAVRHQQQSPQPVDVESTGTWLPIFLRRQAE